MGRFRDGVFVVTGVSSGLGRALAREALAAGHRVVGTVRTEEALAEFERWAPGRAFGRRLEMTDAAAMPALVAGIQCDLGHVDVLVNNAGYGHEGTVEESPLSELRHQLEVNFFGTVALTQAVLPLMRARRRGHILTITSMGGIITLPGIAYYHASKFALEGLFESLGKELRTDWAGRSLMRSERHIADYDEVMGPIRKTRLERHGNQLGDPAKAARAMLAILDAQNPPAHLVLGTDALSLVREKLSAMEREMTTWESLSASTDIDNEKR